MLTGIVAAVLGLLGTAAGIWFKYFRKPPADPVAEAEHGELQAINRDHADSSSIVDELHKSDF